MKVATPTLLPILRSPAQGAVFASILMGPEMERSAGEVARDCRVSLPTALREIERLEDSGLVTTKKVGNRRMVKVVDSPLRRALADALALTYGPVPVITEALRGLPGIERAFIHGSYAARFHGHPGHVPNDIDVLIIGTTPSFAAFEAAQQAQGRLKREVTIHVVTPQEWDSEGGFIDHVKTAPIIELDDLDG